MSVGSPDMLTAVAAHDVPLVWPVVEHWFARACARPGNDLTTNDLMMLCRDSAALLVLIGTPEPNAAGVSQVREHSDGSRSCWVLALGGSAFCPWRMVMAEIEAGAHVAGCRTVEFVGRPGWKRLLPEFTSAPVETGTHFLKILAV